MGCERSIRFPRCSLRLSEPQTLPACAGGLGPAVQPAAGRGLTPPLHEHCPQAEVNRCGHDPKHRAWPLLRGPRAGRGRWRAWAPGVCAWGGGRDGVRGRGSRSGAARKPASCTLLLTRREARRCGCQGRLRASGQPPGCSQAAQTGPRGSRAVGRGSQRVDPGGELRTFPAGSMEPGARRLSPALLTPFATLQWFPRPQKGMGGRTPSSRLAPALRKKDGADNQLWRPGTQAPLTCPNPAHRSSGRVAEPRGRAA